MIERIKPRVTWDELKSGREIRKRLEGLLAPDPHRKGLVLFIGPPAARLAQVAEAVAGEMGRDLYRVDLEALVSKFIGETEKNLDKLIDEAKESSAVLFFDEADALFGKRTGVKDSHDRYANIEISTLVARLENYDGVVILAGNLKGNLDDAFLRRVRHIVDFG